MKLKNILLTIPLALSLSCTNPLENKQLEISRLEDYVIKNIKYERHGFQSPEVTLQTKKGDCDNMVLLLMKLSKDNLNIEPTMYNVFGLSTGIWDEKDKLVGHSIMKYDGVYYDPALKTSGTNLDYLSRYMSFWVPWELNYDEAMEKVQ